MDNDAALRLIALLKIATVLPKLDIPVMVCLKLGMTAHLPAITTAPLMESMAVHRAGTTAVHHADITAARRSGIPAAHLKPFTAAPNTDLLADSVVRSASMTL